tara:strand:+ start:97 stop:552 length:456 start_codon:yes stop_codon:yes gene_type:complete
MTQIYVTFDIIYNSNEHAMIHETWVNLDSFQSQLRSSVTQHSLTRIDNNIKHSFILNNLDSSNKMLKWLQEDEQKEFIIELVNEIKKHNNKIFSSLNFMIDKEDSNYIINVSGKNKQHGYNKYMKKVFKKVKDSIFQNLLNTNMFEYTIKI